MLENPEHSRLYVVVPAYNEAPTIRMVVEELLVYKYIVVVVDDGSAKSLADSLTGLPVHYLKHGVNLGQGAALQTGMEYALSQGASYIATFDADAQHRASDIEKMKEAMDKNQLDIVLGSRFLLPSRQIPFSRKLLLQLARFLNFLFTGLYLTDAHNGLRLLNQKAAETIVLKENRMAHATEILSQINTHRLKYSEVPVQISYSAYSLQKGQTNWSGFRILIDLLLAKIFR